MDSTLQKDAPPLTLGVSLTPDVIITAEWSDFGASLAASVSDLVLKGPLEAVSSGVSALVKLVTSVKVEDNLGFRIWRLAALSVAWSAGQVNSRRFLDDGAIIDIVSGSITKARLRIEKEGLFVPVTFLTRPTSLPIYGLMRTDIESDLKVSVDTYLVKEIMYKIDSSFRRGVFEIWSKKREYFNMIASDIRASGSASAEFELNWEAYRSTLVHDFEVKPLFGQERTGISISQLYVPLRGIWRDDEGRLSLDYDSESSPFNSNIVLLDEELDSWIENDDTEDWLRIIGGGPGSGKSTTLRALARRSADLQSVRPLFIPLQYIGIDNDLRESINAHFVERSDSPFSQPPLSRVSIEDGAPLLLIFDGLDELVAPGEAAKEVVATFANKLNSLVASLSGDGKRTLKVVVSGRMPAFQAARKYLTPRDNGSLEAYGFLPAEVSADHADYALWSLDQRPIWWEQYSSLTGQDKLTPEAFTTKRLEGITQEPLLCYLLALAGYATSHWQHAADNRNRIYSALVDSIYDRGWGDGAIKRHGAGKSLSKNDFNTLMNTIALAAWLGGDSRVASEDKFEEAISIMGSGNAWKTFAEDNGGDVTNLAMNFYMKSSDKIHRAIEFTHKSFGEYLTSRALLSLALEVANDAERKPDYALEDWHRATRTGTATSETLQFLRDEARLWLTDYKQEKGEIRLSLLKGSFQRFATKVDAEGFKPSGSSKFWRVLELEQANSEVAIWMIINSCAKAFGAAGDLKSAAVDLSIVDDGFSYNGLLKRLSRFDGPSMVASCLSYIVANKDNFSSGRVSSADFEGANLDESVFTFCSLFATSFRRASLKGTRFYETYVTGSKFDGADLSGVILHISSFKDCTYENTIGGPAIVSPASFILSGEKDFSFFESNGRVLSAKKSKGRYIDLMSERIDRIKSVESFQLNNLVSDFGRFSFEIDDAENAEEEPRTAESN